MDKKIGFIGAGNMGGAIVGAIAKAGYAKSVYVFEPNREKAEALANEAHISLADREKISRECDIIFLAVKPQIVKTVAEEIAPYIFARENKPTLVSMLAGVSAERVSELFGAPVIRIMPNTPVSVGEGMILVCPDKSVDGDTKKCFELIMQRAGRIDYIDEKLIDAASAVSGCGPAFVYMFIEALADGAVKCGLPRERALEYAEQTVLGAARLALTSDKHPEQLKDEVCSPAGSTMAGVTTLEKGAFRASAIDAVCASYKRTLELGK